MVGRLEDGGGERGSSGAGVGEKGRTGVARQLEKKSMLVLFIRGTRRRQGVWPLFPCVMIFQGYVASTRLFWLVCAIAHNNTFPLTRVFFFTSCQLQPPIIWGVESSGREGLHWVTVEWLRRWVLRKAKAANVLLLQTPDATLAACFLSWGPPEVMVVVVVALDQVA